MTQRCKSDRYIERDVIGFFSLSPLWDWESHTLFICRDRSQYQSRPNVEQ